MSELDKVKKALADARSGITTANGQNASAAQTVRDSAQDMNSLGLEGVATRLYAAADNFDSARSQTDTANAEAEKADNNTAKLSDDTRVSEAIATLNAAVTSMATCAEKLGVAENEAAQGFLYIQQAEMEGLFGEAELAYRVIGEAKQTVEAAKTAAAEHRQRIEERAKRGK